MRKGPKIILIILIILILLAGAFFTYYKFLKPDSEDVYGAIIKGYSNQMSEVMSDNIKKASKPYIQSGSINIDSDMDTYSMLNKIALTYSIGINPDTKIIASDFAYTEQDKDILSGNIYIKDNKLYLESSQIYNKPLYFSDVSEMIDLNDLTSKEQAKDMKYLTDKASYYFKKAMLKANYKTEYGKVSINNKNSFVQKNYMTIDKNNANTIKNDFLSSIKNDSKCMDVLAELSNKKVDELKKDIDSYISNEVSSDFKSVSFEIDTKLITNKVINVVVKEVDNPVLKASYASDNKYNITAYNDNKPAMEGVLTVKDDNVGFVTTYNSYKIDILLTNSNNKSELTIKAIDENDKQIKLTITSNVEYNKKGSKIDTTKAEDASKLSESENNEISQNLMKQFSSSKLLGPYLTQ